MNPDLPDAPVTALDQGSTLAALHGAFRTALFAPDVRRARAIVAEALDSGASCGSLYVDVVRPALADLQHPGLTVRARLAAGIGEAILSDLTAHRPVATARGGSGRAAVLSCRDAGIEAVDGSIAVDFLEADGWSVRCIDTDSRFGTTTTAGAPIELAVAVTSGPEDALRLASVCTQLRRLADPPVILLCDFSGRSRHRAASSALGADAVAHDPEELVRCAAAHLPGDGRRRWGVRLRRSGDVLRLAPTGRLDAVSVGRLADVVQSRMGSFARLELDLSDLAEVDASAVRELGSWPARLHCDGVELVLIGGGVADARLGAADIPPRWCLAG